MDTFRTLTTGLFVGSLIISFIIFILLILISKKKIHLLDGYQDPQRRRYLLSSVLSMVVIATLGLKLNTDYLEEERIVMCDGWMLKQKDLKSDACRPQSN